jgi:CheY-like chemotaxis protein
MTGQHSILIVEDNEDDILLAQRAFRKAGVTAALHVVRDGEEAVSYLEGSGAFMDHHQHPLPAMMLLDLKLPKRSGFDVLHWVRNHPTLRMLPVVVFTTSAQSSDLDRAYALGANSYLKKPATLEGTTELLKTLGLYWLTMNEAPPNLQRK